ncbi:MAG: (Fe-S)-binding protein [Thermodesulfobacteriota bacterium]
MSILEEMQKRMMAEVWKDLRSCLANSECNDVCKDTCPMHLVRDKDEKFTPRRIAKSASEVFQGKMEHPSEKMELIFSCFVCRRCMAECPAKIDLATAKVMARAALTRAGFYPKTLDGLAKNVLEYDNPFGLEEDRFDWLDKELPRSDTLYFVGCNYGFREPEAAKATVDVLKGLGIDFTVSRDEACCGAPLNLMGRIPVTMDYMKKNVRTIKEGNINTVITSCTDCYTVLKLIYGMVIPDVRVMHVSEALLNALKKRDTDLKPLNMKVAYHDPCTLTRVMKITEQPRKVLRSIPGLKVVEFEANREHTSCCGAGGLQLAINEELSFKWAKMRMDESKALGVDAIVTACSGCKVNFRLLQESPVMSVAEVLSKAL